MKKIVLILATLLLSLYSQAQDSMNVSMLFHWDDPELPTEPLYGMRYNEVWGVVVDGREYAVIGSTEGTHIFDVTIPANAYEAVFIPGADDSVVHRDYHDYKGYLYMVSDENNSSLQIADLKHLPDSAPVVYDSQEFFRTTHNIFIDTANGKMYTTQGLIFSLEDPENPKLVNVPPIVNGHDMFVRNDTAFWNRGNSQRMDVFDHSSLTSAPTILGSLASYPDMGYNHSGWLDKSGKIYVMADETYGMDIKICDVSDLSQIKVLSTVNSGGDPKAMPHNVIIRDSFLFVSYYHDGLWIFNISDPENPELAGYYDHHPTINPAKYHGAWGVYPLLPSGHILISDTDFGLFVFEFPEREPTSVPGDLSDEIHVFPNPANDLIFVEKLQYLPDPDLQLLDMTGKLIKSDKGTRLDVSNLPDGVYALQISFPDRMSAHRVIVSK